MKIKKQFEFINESADAETYVNYFSQLMYDDIMNSKELRGVNERCIDVPLNDGEFISDIYINEFDPSMIKKTDKKLLAYLKKYYDIFDFLMFINDPSLDERDDYIVGQRIQSKMYRYLGDVVVELKHSKGTCLLYLCPSDDIIFASMLPRIFVNRYTNYNMKELFNEFDKHSNSYSRLKDFLDSNNMFINKPMQFSEADKLANDAKVMEFVKDNNIILTNSLLTIQPKHFTDHVFRMTPLFFVGNSHAFFFYNKKGFYLCVVDDKKYIKSVARLGDKNFYKKSNI